MNINHHDVLTRLTALADYIATHGRFPQDSRYCNNHIHTTYSFSPYTPTMAVFMAAKAGLPTAGIMDHDAIAGAREFIAAGAIAGIKTTIGFECRCRAYDFADKRINNPDQKGNAYVAVHGIPHKHIDTVEAYLRPYREQRNIRNRAMTARLNSYLSPYGIALDFDKDILPLSQSHSGGSVTERHICYALAISITNNCKGYQLYVLLRELGVNLTDKQTALLADTSREFRLYDLLGILKAQLVGKFYIEATDECPPIRELAAFAHSINAIPAYAYLGDVAADITGDKLIQKFEDDYLDDLFRAVKSYDFTAITYMPSRNTKQQLLRVQQLCKQLDLMEISGEDINSPRQSFICNALTDPQFSHLIDATYKLIKHEYDQH